MASHESMLHDPLISVKSINKSQSNALSYRRNMTLVKSVLNTHKNRVGCPKWINSIEAILLVALCNLGAAAWSFYIEVQIYMDATQKMEMYSAATTTAMTSMAPNVTTNLTTTTGLDLHNLYKIDRDMSRLNALLFAALILLFLSVLVEYFSMADERAISVLNSFRNELWVHSSFTELSGIYVPEGKEWRKKQDGQAKFVLRDTSWEFDFGNATIAKPVEIGREPEGIPPHGEWSIIETGTKVNGRAIKKGTIIVKSEHNGTVLDDEMPCLMWCVRCCGHWWFPLYLLAGILSFAWPYAAYKFRESDEFTKVPIFAGWPVMSGVGMVAIMVSLSACLGTTMSRPVILTRELIRSLKLYLHNEHLRIDGAWHKLKEGKKNPEGVDVDATDDDIELKHMVWKRFSLVMMHIMSLWSPTASAPWFTLIGCSGFLGVFGFVLFVNEALRGNLDLFLFLMAVVGFGLVALTMWRVIWLNNQLTSTDFHSDSVRRIAYGAKVLAPDAWKDFVQEMDVQLELNHIRIFLISANWPALLDYLKKLIGGAGGLTGAWTVVQAYIKEHHLD